MEKKYKKKCKVTHIFFFFIHLNRFARRPDGGGSAEREKKKDGGEKGGLGGGVREKEFSYRRIILSHFLRRHLRRGSWLGLIKS